MRIFKTIVLSLGLFFLEGAWAATSTPDNVTSMAAFGVGNVGVLMSTATPLNPAGCANTASQKWYKMIDTTDHGKNMYAMLLAAKTSNTKLSLLIDDTSCTGGYAVITAIIFN